MGLAKRSSLMRDRRWCWLGGSLKEEKSTCLPEEGACVTAEMIRNIAYFCKIIVMLSFKVLFSEIGRELIQDLWEVQYDRNIRWNLNMALARLESKGQDRTWSPICVVLYVTIEGYE